MDDKVLPPLEWVRAFEAAARLGSFTAAAKETGLTQAAISQRIGHLEQHLGVALFDRGTRSIALTVQGEAWVPHVRVALDGLRSSTEAVFGRRNDRLTVSASQSIIELWLMPRLERIRHVTGAEVSVQTLMTGAQDAPQDETIRIRYGSGEWPHTYRAKLYHEEIVPVAAPSLAGRGETWTEWPRISCSGPRPGWQAWVDAFDIPMTPVPTLRFDTHLSALSAAKTGLGVFLASLPLCRDMLDTGALVRLGTRSLSHHESYWLLADRKALSQRQWRGLADAIEGA